MELWWYDCSARALKSTYRNWTRPLFTAAAMNDVDLNQLVPGDLAATSDGVHIMVYLGQGQWLEADPDLEKVYRGQVPVENEWFNVPVQIIRWKQLETPKD